MMKIKIKFFAGIRDITNQKETDLEFSTDSILLNDLISKLIDLYGNDLKTMLENEQAMVSVNGDLHDLTYNGSIIINDGDRCAIFPPIAGG